VNFFGGNCPCCGRFGGLTSGGCLYCGTRTGCGACGQILTCGCGRRLGEHACPNVVPADGVEVVPQIEKT